MRNAPRSDGSGFRPAKLGKWPENAAHLSAVMVLLAACSQPRTSTGVVRALEAPAQAAHEPLREAERANPDCKRACEHAVDLQLALVESAAYPGTAQFPAKRDGYVAACETHCEDFRVDCALGATSVTELVSACTLSTKPVVLNAVLDDVYPFDEYPTAPREPTQVPLMGYASSPVVDLPRGLNRSTDDPWAWEAPGQWMSPVKFRFNKEWDLGTTKALRERFKTDPAIAESEAEGRAMITSARADGRGVSTLVFLPTGADGSGILCEGFATRGSGFNDVGEVARFLEQVCRSLHFP